MFIKNPNNKEPYTFRINPELLENFKHYAKATNQTVPQILNDMVEEKIEGLHLTNDYLIDTLDSTKTIGLPPLVDIYNNGKYKEFGLFFENDNQILYEFQRIPNNLDIWDDKEGYKSNKRGIDHEGLSFVLAPDLITKPEYIQTPELLLCCLVPIYFRVSLRKKTIQVKNISFTDTLEKIRASPNIELLDEFTTDTTAVTTIIKKYTDKLKNARETPEGAYKVGVMKYNNKNSLLTDLHSKLVMELEELCTTINKNIVRHLDKAIERTNQSIEYETIEFKTYSDIMEENQALQNKVNELQTKINNMSEIAQKIDDLEARVKTWESVKTQKQK